MTVAAAGGGVGILGLIGIAVPLASAIVAIVLLGPQRSKLVGESLGDALENLTAQLTRVQAESTRFEVERNALRDERDAERVNLAVKTEELRLCNHRREAAEARLAELGEAIP